MVCCRLGSVRSPVLSRHQLLSPGFFPPELRRAPLSALQEVGTKQLGGVEIACLEMGEVPKDRVRAPFLAVGDWNGNVKILGLSPENLLEQVWTGRVSVVVVVAESALEQEERWGRAAGLSDPGGGGGVQEPIPSERFK